MSLTTARGPLGVDPLGRFSVPLPAFGSQSIVVGPAGLGFPAEQYGSASVDAGGAGRFLGDVLRYRFQVRDGVAHVDFVVPSELR